MHTFNTSFETVKIFFEERILKKHGIIAHLREETDLLEVLDKSASRVKLTVVFWEASKRVSILIDDREIMDEEFGNTEDLVKSIDCVCTPFFRQSFVVVFPFSAASLSIQMGSYC